MRSLSKEGIEGFLRCLHFQRKTASEAFEMLSDYIGGPLEDREKFETFFNQLYDDPLLLANQPEPIQKNLMKFLDLKSRLALRSTTKVYRQLVDSTSFHIEKLTLRFGTDWFEVATSDGYRLRMDTIDDYECTKCVVSDGNQKWNCDGIRFDDIVTKEFKKFLFNKRLTIGTLEVFQEESEVWMEYAFPIILSDMFGGPYGNPTINIQTLDIIDDYDIYLDIYLSVVDETAVEGLFVYTYHEERDTEDISDLFSTPQWKNLKFLGSNYEFDARVENIVDNFTHLWQAEFKLSRTLTPAGIVRMKDRLLENCELREIKITHEMKKEAFDEINVTLGTYNMVDQENPSWAHFVYPHLKNKVLKVCVTNKYVWFKSPCYVEQAEQEEAVKRRRGPPGCRGCVQC